MVGHHHLNFLGLSGIDGCIGSGIRFPLLRVDIQNGSFIVLSRGRQKLDVTAVTGGVVPREPK
jgi:hypothetical protein